MQESTNRWEKAEKAEEHVDLPNNPLPELTAMFMDAGPYEEGGMGSIPISASELMAWQRGSGQHLTPWEFKTVRTLSRCYLAEYQKASDPMRPAPHGSELSSTERTAVAKRIRGIFRD